MSSAGFGHQAEDVEFTWREAEVLLARRRQGFIFDRQSYPGTPADLLCEQPDRSSRDVGEESDSLVQRGRRLSTVTSLTEQGFGVPHS